MLVKGEKAVTAWEKVEVARNKLRPSTKYYIAYMIENFIELQGDRCFGNDIAILGGVGKINDIPVTVIGTTKGATLQESIERNFGMPKPEGYRKALRLMKQAEKFKRPIICFIDTPGAFCGIEAEERGIGKAIADNLLEMGKIKTPILSIFIGEGGSGGALALGVADRVLILENAIYSILSPEGFSAILWKDVSRTKEAAEVMKITAKELKLLGVIDSIIEEPQGGAHTDPIKMAGDLKLRIIEELYELSKLDEGVLLEKRYKKFRDMGNVWS